MHSKSANIEIMINDKADEVKEELFQSLFSRYKIGLETSVKGSDFIFDCVQLLYYNSKLEKQYSFNDSKGRSMTLHCSKKTVSIIKRNSINA